MKQLILAIAFMAALPLGAEPPAEILRQVDRLRNPHDSFVIDVELTSYTSTGKSESSKYRVYGRSGDRSVVEFLAPAPEKGKALLMLRDAMWIYMPSASRPIRISPLQRLMGQASNGDVARMNFSVDYNPALVADEDGAWVLDLTAKDPSISYNRVRLWVDQKTHQPRRADFFVVSGKLIKRATYRENAIDIDDLLRPGNHTLMRYSNLAARNNPDRMFTKDNLGK